MLISPYSIQTIVSAYASENAAQLVPERNNEAVYPQSSASQPTPCPCKEAIVVALILAV
jgi:hypothetical protein